jgi:hypothetical protein
MSRELSARPIKTAISETLDHRLKLYCVAAAAAGVSVLALAQPTEAEVLFKRQRIQIGSTPVLIDLNHDGIADFQFAVHCTAVYHVGSFCTLSVAPLEGGAVVGFQSWEGRPGPFASALSPGAEVGHFSPFAEGGVVIDRNVQGFCDDSSCSPGSASYGAWINNPPNRFLGVKFLIDDQIHYGWVRMQVNGLSGTIVGYAYETVPNRPIIAHDPPEGSANNAESPQKDQSLWGSPSLGMLALGADGVALWRHDETLATGH